MKLISATNNKNKGVFKPTPEQAEQMLAHAKSRGINLGLRDDRSLRKESARTRRQERERAKQTI